jgi:hypothetical protein
MQSAWAKSGRFRIVETKRFKHELPAGGFSHRGHSAHRACLLDALNRLPLKNVERLASARYR